jgi:CubicO group peptidase (beta-lactamase class C family)
VTVGRRGFVAMLGAGAASALVPSRVAASPTPEQSAIARELADVPGPGCAAAAVVRGKVVAIAARGNKTLRGGGACDERTVFRIASVTKVISGMALLTVRDRGLVSLDDPLTRFFPEAERIVYPSARAQRVTLRHVVTHTSGLPRMVPNAISESGLASMLAGAQLAFAPGSQTAYSNFAVGLIGPVVRRVTGTPFRDYVRANVTAPLGMEDLAWEAGDVDPSRLARGHEWKRDADGARTLVPATGEWRMGAAESFGGAYSSAPAMGALVAAQLAAYEPGEDSPPLAKKALRESHEPQLAAQTGAERHGVCWWLGDDRVWHDGATDEYSASIFLAPHARTGAVVLSNQPDVGMVARAARRIALALA